MKSIFTWLFLLSAYTLVAQAPVNDECSGAIELIPDDSSAYEVTLSTVENSTISSDDLLFIHDSPNRTINNSAPDLWYKFTATSNFIDIMEVGRYTLVYLYKGESCSDLEFINLGAQGFGLDNFDVNAAHAFTNLEIGATYYIRVFHEAAYNIKLSTEDPCGNTANPFSLHFVATDTPNVYKPEMSGGTAPYRLFMNGYDYIPEIDWIFYINSIYDDAIFFLAKDATGCTRYLSQSGIIYTNVNKLALVDYKMSVFPNPAQYSSKLSLSVEKATEMQIQISNISGQVLSSEVVLVEGDMVFDLNISDLPNGVYLVCAMSEVGIQTKELVISK